MARVGKLAHLATVLLEAPTAEIACGFHAGSLGRRRKGLEQVEIAAFEPGHMTGRHAGYRADEARIAEAVNEQIDEFFLYWLLLRPARISGQDADLIASLVHRLQQTEVDQIGRASCRQ